MNCFSYRDGDEAKARWSTCKPQPEPEEVLTQTATWHCVEQLPDRLRVVLLSSCGFSDVPKPAQLAAAWGCSRQSICEWRKKAIRQVRRLLDRGGQP